MIVIVDILHPVNELDSAAFAQIAPFQVRLWAVLPQGFLQVSASDRQRGSIHRPAPPARRLVCFIQHLHRHSSYAQFQYYLG